MPTRQSQYYNRIIQGSQVAQFIPYEIDFAEMERKIIAMCTDLRDIKVEIDQNFLDAYRAKTTPQEPELFEFDALSDIAKDRVRSWYLESYGVDTDPIQDEITKELKEFGYPIKTIKIEVEKGRNNGVAFYGYLREWQITKAARRLLEPRKAWYIRKAMVAGANIEMQIGSRYYDNRANSANMKVGYDTDTYKAKGDMKNFRELVKEFRDAIEGESKYLCKILQAKAEKMYAELTTPDKLDDKIRAFGMKFHENGERHRPRRQRPQPEHDYVANGYAMWA